MSNMSLSDPFLFSLIYVASFPVFSRSMLLNSNKIAADDESPHVNEVIGKLTDVPAGTKKIFEVRGRKILVINDNGKFYAINGICSHLNLPLEQGVYSKGKIRCPYHGACFNVKTGDIEDYPGFDSLHSFEVKNVGGDLVIQTTEKQLLHDRRTKYSKISSACKDAPIVVVGSGPSAANFVEHARLNGCITPIQLVTEERIPPYDRIWLSKKPAATENNIRLRSDDYYKENQIDIITGAKVVTINPVRRTVSLLSGSQLRYSKLVLAVGGITRKLKVPGSDLENVFTLRQIEEANAIAVHSIGKNVVCIGGSFIGMEIASALLASAESVTVVCSSDEPLPALGKDIGAAIRKRFESKGISILVKAHLERLEGTKAVSSVILKGGITIKADVVVAGIGINPSTEWLKNSCIDLDEKGFIKVDRHFRTSTDWIYAIGDAVTAPLPLWDIKSINIQHFQTAQTHGQLLGFSIMGKPQPHPIIPFFWTVFFMEFGIRFAGCIDGSTETIVHGNIDEMNFSKYYLKNNVVVGVANAGPLPTAIQFLTLFQQKIKVTRAEVEKNETDDWSLLL